MEPSTRNESAHRVSTIGIEIRRFAIDDDFGTSVVPPEIAYP